MWPNTPPGGGLYRHSAYEWVLLLQVEKYWHCDYEWVYSRWRIIPAMCLWMSLFQVEKHWHCAYEWFYSRWKNTGIVPMNELLHVELYLHRACEWVYSSWRAIPAMNVWMILFQVEKHWHCAYEWFYSDGKVPALCLRMSLLQVESYTGFVPTNEFDECSILSLCGDRRLCVEMPPPGV